MSFADPVFAAFLLVALGVFLFLPGLRSQLRWLLAASYVFYAWWDPRFLVLLCLSSAIDYGVGLALSRQDSPGPRKALLVVSLLANLGLLGTFKYAGLLAETLSTVTAHLGLAWSVPQVDLVLPLGISFYTFQTLSYTIDVYRRQIEPCRSPLKFFFYVAAFPQLVSGPVVRARELLPQLDGDLRQKVRTGGLFLILYGAVKKVLLADLLADLTVDPVFEQSLRFDSWSHLLAVYGFAFQIFLDFSAYSDIARGCGRLLGLELPVNFRSPYLARNPREYWSRWHITLSTWLRDYVFFPLGGTTGSTLATYRNAMLTLILGGLWHGATANFLMWGALHGALFAGYSLIPKPASPHGRLRRWVAILVFFHLGSLGRVFFRADSFSAAMEFMADMCLAGGSGTRLSATAYPLLLACLLLHNYCEPRLDAWAETFDEGRRPLLLASIAVVALTLCAVAGHRLGAHRAFVYFQF